jgi:Polyketide cyclase / dehydrase and lipid transport
MPTNLRLNHSETRSIAIDAPPERVHRFIADAINIPRWAPAFATAIRRSDKHWVATTARGEAEIIVASNPESGTLDILSAADRTRGAFARVISNGPGSEVLFTLFFEPGTPEQAVTAQMTVVDEELASIKRLTQSS